MTVSRALNSKVGVNLYKEKSWRKQRSSDISPTDSKEPCIPEKQYLGISCPTLIHSFFPEICLGVKKSTDEKGYERYLLLYEQYIKKRKNNDPAFKKSWRVNLSPAQDEDKPTYTNTLCNDIPFVLVDQYFRNLTQLRNFGWYQGAYDAVRYLIELGHRQIVISAALFLLHRRRCAWLVTGKPWMKIKSRKNNRAGGFSKKDGFDAMNRLFSKKPTAVLVANDIAALGAMRAIEKMGLKVRMIFQ